MPGTYVPTSYLPILTVLVLATLFGLGPLLASFLVRPRRPYTAKLSAYESGNPAVGEPRIKFSVRFYIIAMLFMVFDVEAVFLYPLAVAYDFLGLYGFVEMMLFLFILIVGYIYAWERGALEWE